MGGFRAGAPVVLQSRKYSEMGLDDLSGAADVVRELKLSSGGPHVLPVYCLTSSTRRFLARFSSVSLEATGAAGPSPAAVRRAAATLFRWGGQHRHSVTAAFGEVHVARQGPDVVGVAYDVHESGKHSGMLGVGYWCHLRFNSESGKVPPGCNLVKTIRLAEREGFEPSVQVLARTTV